LSNWTDGPRDLQQFRDWGEPNRRFKLGEGVAESQRDEFIEVATVRPPRPVIDTTGAGDAFYADSSPDLFAERIRRGGRIAAATAAACVTDQRSAGLLSWRKLADWRM
jgi:sugar/nucleoside kinase (ribokinase family)